MYERQDRAVGAWNLGDQARGHEENTVLQRCEQ